MQILKQSSQGIVTINLSNATKVSQGNTVSVAPTAHHIGVRIDKTRSGDARKTIKK